MAIARSTSPVPAQTPANAPIDADSLTGLGLTGTGLTETGLEGEGSDLGAEALASGGTHTVAGITPEQYPDVFDRIRAGFKLEDIDSPRIDQQLAFYANNPQYLERVFGRAGLYLHHIVQEIEARGMPLELALLPVVESAQPRSPHDGRSPSAQPFSSASRCGSPPRRKCAAIAQASPVPRSQARCA